MATPTLTPNSREEQDERYDPSLLNERERQVFAGIEEDYDKTADDSQENKNIDKAREVTKEAEENPNEIPYRGGSSSQNERQPIRGRMVNFAKKKGPLTGLIGILLTGAFGLSLLSPGLLLVQLKETMTDKYNDQLAAMDMRQTAILKKKLSSTTLKGSCGTVISIRCKYQTLGDKHVERLRVAGITIEGEEAAFGRTKPQKFIFEGRSLAASDMLKEARSSPDLRSAMRHGYNPKFAAFADAVAAKVRSILGLKKSKNITPSTDEEKMKEQIVNNASGEAAAGEGRATTYTKDDDTVGYKDAAGEDIDKIQYEAINNANDEIESRVKVADEVKKASLKAGLKGALTATAFGTGAADTLCTAWTVIRVAGFAAKVYGARQLIRYSYQFMNTADAIKAGDATPEEVAYLGKILTSLNSDGQSATDSNGYRYAAYGDIFDTGSYDTSVKEGELTDAAVDKNVIKNETSKYVNGQIIPDNLLAKLVSSIPSSSGTVAGTDKICQTIKSWQGQTVIFTLAVAGVVAAVFTGGGTLGVGAVLGATAGVAASIAFALITPKLIDMAKGELITGNENGNEAGNAITSGAGGFNAQASQGRGLAVLNKQDAVEYNQTSVSTAADYNEVERYEKSPFDATSKNTFIGSIASSLLPYSSKMLKTGSTITSTASLVTQSIGNIISPQSSAADMGADELQSCSDPEYKDLAADPFCNLRYGLSKTALETDPESVLDYMENNGYIDVDSETGTPGGANGAVYQKFIDQCIDRETSIGDNLSPGDEGNGDDCIQGRGGSNEARNTMFRLFYLDTSISDGMDSDLSEGGGEAAGDGAEFRIGSFNMCYGVAVDGGYSSCAHGVDYKPRLENSVNVIKNEKIQVVGLQEIRENQWTDIQKSDALGGEYDIYPKAYNVGYGAQNPIVWNKNDFELVEGKMIAGYTVTSGHDDKANVQVKLRAKSGQEFYVINMHEPVGTNNATDAKLRTESATARAKYVKELSTDGTPIFLTGDFNSKYEESGPGVNQTGYNGTRQNLPYCILTDGTGLWDAWDASSGRTGKCPSPDYDGSPGPVDHIYMNTNVSVSSYKYFGGGAASNGSDHNTLYVDVKIPGGGEDGSCDTGCDARAATFNLRGASHDTATSTPWPERMDKSINIIEGKKLDVVGLQETQAVQRSALINKIGGTYDFFPDDKSVQNPIMWNKQRYSFVNGGNMPNLKYFNDSKLQAPWVILKSKTSGKEFYVLNTHDPAHSENEYLRYYDANQHASFIQSIKSKGIPIIFTGDFNSGYSLRHNTDNDTYQNLNANLTYCILTKNNLMYDVFDLAEKRPITCPNPGNDNTVDHIFVSGGVSASNYQRLTNSGSDHDAHIIDLTFSESGDSR